MAKKKKEEVAENQLSAFSEPVLDKLNIQNRMTDEQKNFVFFEGKESVILAATAGAGKTASSVQKLKELLNRGVDPSKIIFFSFTRAATEELQKRIGRDDIKITTIHSFCMGLLAKMGKHKNISTFHDFIEWYKDTYKPAHNSTKEDKHEFYDVIGAMYEDMDFLASSIAAFKLQSADNIKCKVPDFYEWYKKFLKEKRSRDFSDMLIEVRDCLREDKWLKMFKNKYEYIFVDEYQDTSTIQLQILLALNAQYYYLIGDRNQSIYGYSGANCNMLEQMIKARRPTIEMTLSINFRSDKDIVENANKYSSLKAIAHSQENGDVNKTMLLSLDELVEVLKEPGEVAILVRTNAVIKSMEYELLKRRIPMKYFNYISHSDMKNYKNGEISGNTKDKLKKLGGHYEREIDVFAFIESNKDSKKFITTIHKSKGREFDTCVVVNSIAPDVIDDNGFSKAFTEKQLKRLSFKLQDADEEAKNIHYVGVTRSKHKLYFMIYDY
jgi:DNA helicase-2/ATP-dependent DNA helicase PcrA